MQGKPVSFSNSPNKALEHAAAGPANAVAEQKFNRDLSRTDHAMKARPRINPEGSMSGLNNSKSAYIQNNKAGYQARPRPQMDIPKTNRSLDPKDKMPKIRMSDYSKGKNTLRGLSRLI